LEQGIYIHMSSDALGIPAGIQKTAFEKTHIGCTSENGDHHEGVDWVHTGTARDGFKARHDLTADPAGSRFLVIVG
jgi:hypothetical protein